MCLCRLNHLKYLIIYPNISPVRLYVTAYVYRILKQSQGLKPCRGFLRNQVPVSLNASVEDCRVRTDDRRPFIGA
jgi:hypothetical protein